MPVVNRKSIEILGNSHSPLLERYTNILRERETKRLKLKSLMEFEKMMRDPENINPTFHPIVNNRTPLKRKMTK